MARPKKSATASDDQKITVSFRDYLDGQNRVAYALSVFHSMTSSQLQASSSQLQAINAAMGQVQTTTKAALAGAGYEEPPANIDEYPALADLLRKEKHLLNPLGDPLAAAGAAAAAAAGASSTAAVPEAVAATVASVSAAEGVKQRKKREKKPKDPNAPKQPVTAYFLYLQSNREELKDKMPGATPGEIQKRGTEFWKALPEDEKELYKSQYRKNWDEYQRKLKEYKALGGEVAPEDLKPADDDAVMVAVVGDEDEVMAAPPPPKGKSKKAKEPKAPKAAVAVVPAPAVEVVAAKAKTPERPKKAAAKDTTTERKKKKGKEDAVVVEETPKSPEDGKKKKRKSEGEAEGSKKKKPKRTEYAGTLDF